jgi:hypothetical protein
MKRLLCSISIIYGSGVAMLFDAQAAQAFLA